MSKWIKKVIWMFAFMVILIPNIQVYAAEKNKERIHIGDENISCCEIEQSDSNCDESGTTDKERLFVTEYIVLTTKEPMRSGPGTSYSIVGYLYKDDIVNVSTIENGWAKFKVNGEWRYIKESSLKKC